MSKQYRVIESKYSVPPENCMPQVRRWFRWIDLNNSWVNMTTATHMVLTARANENRRNMADYKVKKYWGSHE